MSHLLSFFFVLAYQSIKINSQVSPMGVFINLSKDKSTKMTPTPPTNKQNKSAKSYRPSVSQKPPASSKPDKSRPTPKRVSRGNSSNQTKSLIKASSNKDQTKSAGLSRNPDIQKMYYSLAQSTLNEHITNLQNSCTPQEFSTITSLWSSSVIYTPKTIEQ